METENINHQVTVILLKKIIELLGTKDQPIESVDIDNFDEIKAHLRNELLPVVKSIKEGSDRSDILKAIKKLSEDINRIDFKPTINVEGSEVTVPDIKIPEIKVPDIFIPEIHVPTPQVTVNVPEIQIPAPIVSVAAPIVNMPEVNLDEVINELDIGLKRLRQNNRSNPIFVRITDVEKIVTKLDEVRQASKEVMLGFPGSIRIQNATGGAVDFDSIGNAVPTTCGNGLKNVTTAGTRVALATSTTVKSVTIKARSTNTGIIYVGSVTVSSANGFQLSAKDSISMDISNLSTINIDSSVSGEGVTYMWVN